MTKNQPLSWLDHSVKAFGPYWVLGRSTEKAIRKHSKYDPSSGTYKAPRFVTKTEYQVERENWYQSKIAFYVKELDALRAVNPEPNP